MSRFLKIWAAEDHSVQLVGIADTLVDPPFGLVHRLSAFPSSFSRFEALGDRGLAHWNIRRDLGPFGDSPNGLGDPQGVLCPFFQPLCSFLLIASMLCLSIQIPET
ncbi:hypothetical protein H5410_052400 [Solanum commersonii]|uniref:Uncharacterized protein n=1 Tax=Solanum commersonii TaxID=4109 RepID=A0A9J5X2X5_SOLCO|nr:hypothetical protein H5410_052400 [Solanum commersonii]